ncbi:MAG: glycosyltransferase [Deltaproteobacteria bacterium]|nr:glycosyltransferase [Deltaproteobacteria bacterium]
MEPAETHNPAVIRVHGMDDGSPKVTVLIPSLDGYRGGQVPYLIRQLKDQSFKDLEILIIKGVRPNGKARNVGAREARGKILISIDDDVTLGHEHVVENLVRYLESDGTIGLLGISKLIPEDSTRLQRRIAKEIPRSISPIYERLAEGDLVDHTCIAIRRDLYFEVGMENEKIIRGTDPDLRHRLRKAGYRIAICPDSWGYHPVPGRFGKIMRMFFQNGMGSAWVRKHYPEFAIHDSEDHRKPFRVKTTLLYRLGYSISSILKCMLRGHFIYAVARVVYAFGYIYGTMTGKSGDADFDREQMTQTA